MAGLRDVLEAMSDQIRSALDTADLPVQVEPRMVLEPTPLTIDLFPGDVARDHDTAGFDDVDGGYLLTVRARINTPDFDAAYDVLLSLMDDEDDLCLVQSLYDDPTLGGYAADVNLVEQTGLRAYEHPSGQGAHLGCQWNFLVIAAKS